MANKESKLTEQVKKYRSAVMEGTLLAIDPASGGSSLPGYAIFKGSVLQEYGTITLPKGQEIHLRLQALCKSLLEDFETPDILVVENIPPFMSTAGKGNFANRAVINLHKSIGCIIGVVQCPHLIEVTPKSWRQLVGEDYIKLDENDALMMACRVLQEANNLSGTVFDLTKYMDIVRCVKGKQ